MVNILIVDDDLDFRLVMKGFLEKEDYVCTLAASAAEARQAMDERSFELMVLDVKMPGESGIDFLNAVHPSIQDTAVVVISGIDDPELAEAALELGAYGYLIKPVGRNEVLITVANALRRRELEIAGRRYRQRLEDLTAQQAAELAESEDRFRRLVETMTEGLGVMDENGRLSYVNERLCEMLGYSSEELLGRQIPDLLDEVEKKKWEREIEKRRHGKETRYEIAWLTKGGGRLHTLVSGKPIIDEEGRFKGSIGVITDLTEQRQRIKELSCLYSVAELCVQPDLSWPEIARRVIDLIPDAWPYEGVTGVRMVIDGQEFETDGFSPGEWALQAEIVIKNEPVGTFEVHYDRKRDDEAGGAFLEEERRLINTTAGLVGAAVEAQKAKATIAEREAEYHELIHNINSIILRIDPQGRITFINEYAQEFFGYSEEEIIGRPALGTITPERESTGRDLTELVRSITSDPGRHAFSENENIKKNGERVWVAWTNRAVMDEEGRLVEILSVGTDITPLKYAAEAVREREERLRMIMDTVTAGILIIDAETRTIVDANPAVLETLGASRDQVVGSVCHRNICPAREGECPILDRGESIVNMERTLLRLDGKEVPVLETCVPLMLEGRDHLLETFVDITERKIVESQLAQAHKLESIGQLAAGIAHEINTPIQYVGDNTRFLQEAFSDLGRVLEKYGELMAALKGGGVTAELIDAVEAVVEEVELDYLAEDIPQAIEQSLEGVERVASIVRAMKEFSHPGGEEKTAVDLNRTIQNTVTVARNEWKYVAEMELDLDPSLPPVPLLVGEFNQAVLNMIINAAHAIAEVVGDGSQEKGTITVSTRRQGDWVEVRISDTGPGIPEAIRNRVFDPFFTTKEVGKGTGQGLALARAVVVDKLGGELTFETEPGRGTDFIIRLPLESDSPEEA